MAKACFCPPTPQPACFCPPAPQPACFCPLDPQPACSQPTRTQPACYLLDLQPVAECVIPYLVADGTFMIFLRTSRRAREWIKASPCLSGFFQPLPPIRCYVPDQTLLEEFLYSLIMRLTYGWRFQSDRGWFIVNHPDQCCRLSEKGIMSRYFLAYAFIARKKQEHHDTDSCFIDTGTSRTPCRDGRG